MADVLTTRAPTGRIAVWVVARSSFELTFQQRTALKCQALGDEIDECLGLDGRPWLEGELEGAELNRPLCNPSGGGAIVKDFTDRETCGHRYGMRLEVVH